MKKNIHATVFNCFMFFYFLQDSMQKNGEKLISVEYSAV